MQLRGISVEPMQEYKREHKQNTIHFFFFSVQKI